MRLTDMACVVLMELGGVAQRLAAVCVSRAVAQHWAGVCDDEGGCPFVKGGGGTALGCALYTDTAWRLGAAMSGVRLSDVSYDF